MRKLVIATMAAATMVAAAPAAVAQVAIEGPGVGVRVGPEPRYRDRDSDYYRDRSAYRSYGWRERGCRTVTVRERLPDGSTVVRTRERC